MHSQISYFSNILVDCEWSEWTETSPCSASCGKDASKNKTRSILREAQHGGKNCSGHSTQIENCNLQPCPGTVNSKRGETFNHYSIYLVLTYWLKSHKSVIY